jgi:hypothetical protein
MKITSAAQIASRNSNAARKMDSVPLAKATDLFTEAQIGSMHRRAGKAAFAETILTALASTEASGYKLCHVLRDIKRTAERTLKIA